MGTAIPHISITNFGRFPVPLPPLAEQQEIVRRVEALFALADQVEARFQKAKAQVDKLTSSLLAKAFRGEMVKQDANDEPASVLLERIRKQREESEKPKIIQLRFPKSKRPKISQPEFDIVPASSAENIIELRAAFDTYVLHQTDFKIHRTVLEKAGHFAEYHCGLELHRNPLRDVAGPVDFPSRMKVEAKAKELNWYSTRGDAEVEYLAGKNLVEALPIAEQFMGGRKQLIDNLIRELAKLSTRKCSIVATVYSAWNDLLILKQPASEGDIIHEARFNWHPEKEKISTSDWADGLKWLRKNNMIPSGKGKPVGRKQIA